MLPFLVLPLGSLWRLGRGARIAIVTHAGFTAMLLKALLDHLPGDGFWYHHHNTAISRVDFGTEAIQIHYLNRVDHLPPDSVT